MIDSIGAFSMGFITRRDSRLRAIVSRSFWYYATKAIASRSPDGTTAVKYSSADLISLSRIYRVNSCFIFFTAGASVSTSRLSETTSDNLHASDYSSNPVPSAAMVFNAAATLAHSVYSTSIPCWSINFLPLFPVDLKKFLCSGLMSAFANIVMPSGDFMPCIMPKSCSNVLLNSLNISSLDVNKNSNLRLLRLLIILV